jgi:hypothetical protein
LAICFDKCEHSPIEHLIINSRFRIDSFNNLLFCLPQLRHLSINCLVECPYIDIELCPILLKYFKYISLNLDSIRFNRFEKLVKHLFHSIEVLRLNTSYDQAYLDAKRWEDLILSSIPNLRIFDINHDHINMIVKKI